MKPTIRITTAYVVGSIITNSSFSHIMAKAENQYLKMTGRFTMSNIDVEEYDTGNKAYGMIQGGQGAFVHEGENASIKFKLDSNRFTGSDSDSGKSFSGEVIGKSVKIYDYDEGKNFLYYLSE